MCKSTADFTSHDIFEDPHFQISREEVSTLWHDYGLSLTGPSDVPLEKDADIGVEKLRKRQKKYSIVTARNGNDREKKRQTLEWISFHFPEIRESDIHFVNHYREEALPKSLVCKEYGISLMIDDHMENASDLSRA
jgi:hypothetical protein